MKIGVALSGGGIKGLAHAGVLKALEENQIKIDIIGGTSAGSMVASLYAMGYTPDEILECFKSNFDKILGGRKITLISCIKHLINNDLRMQGLRKGEDIENVFEKLANIKNIDKISKIKMPIVIPSVDLNDSKEYIFTNNIPKGEDNNNRYITEIGIGEAVRASSSFPAVFNLCTINKHTFIDGGALNNIPVNEVKKQGADKVIAVKFKEEKINENSNMMEIVMKTIDIMGSKIIENNLNKSDYILNIDASEIGFLDARNIEKCFMYGYEAVNKNINNIKSSL